MSLFDSHRNMAYSLVAVAPSPASSGTSLTVTTGDGTKFPAVPFNATVWPGGAFPTTANAEIVRVTNVTGDVLTITRQAESTNARSILVGDLIGNTATVKTFTDLENQFSITTQTGDYSLLPTDSTILVNATIPTNINVLLPTAVGIAGKVYTVKKIDSTNHSVTLQTSLSQTIDGQLTQVMTVQYTAFNVISDGANWFIF